MNYLDECFKAALTCVSDDALTHEEVVEVERIFYLGATAVWELLGEVNSGKHSPEEQTNLIELIRKELQEKVKALYEEGVS